MAPPSVPATLERDWVDRTVQELWIDNPGMGIQALLESVVRRATNEHERTKGEHDENQTLAPQNGCNDAAVGFSLVEGPPDPSSITKPRIKQAKAWIPYRYVASSQSFCFEDVEGNDEAFVRSKLQERVSLHAVRQYKKADELEQALAAMGVQLDNRLKTWTLTKNVPKQSNLLVAVPQDAASSATETNDSLDPLAASTSSVSCKFCHKIFPSRNLVFKHLRDPKSGCGTAIFATGRQIPQPPSEVDRQQRHEVAAQRRRRPAAAHARTARHAHASCSLWMGDLPVPWTLPKRQYALLRAMLFCYLPRTIHRPWVKQVTRKAYRKTDVHGNENIYHGYAIVVFRDAEEASAGFDALNEQKVETSQVFREEPDYQKNGSNGDHGDNNKVDGDGCATLPNFCLKVKRVEKGDATLATYSNESIKDNGAESSAGHLYHALECGSDPPLRDQLLPLDMKELRTRMAALDSKFSQQLEQEKARRARNGKNGSNSSKEEAETIVARLSELYTAQWGPSGRRIVRHMGRAIPSELCETLLSLLQSLKWPARNERGALAAERYLVLQTNVTNDLFYGDLRQACRNLMDWADPDYYYSGIAVTKNFVASPHRDHRDVSFQYAVSLGNFVGGEGDVGGGELCVEGREQVQEDGTDKTAVGEFVNVVCTHNRIARCDGRHVHWVRPWQSGDRYSLIFYNTSERQPTPIMPIGVDENWLAHEL